MTKLIFNDGTELFGDAVESDISLTLYLGTEPLGYYFPILNDPEKTKKIESINNTGEYTYIGYTHLTMIQEYPSGSVVASLKKT